MTSGDLLLPSDVFFLKIQAWVNEKFAPELLESKADLVECMLDQIKEMASSNYYYIIIQYNNLYLTWSMFLAN